MPFCKNPRYEVEKNRKKEQSTRLNTILKKWLTRYILSVKPIYTTTPHCCQPAYMGFTTQSLYNGPNHSPVLEPLKLNLSFGLPFTPLPFCLPLVADTVVGFKTIYFDLIVSLMELLKFKTSWYSILLNKTRFAEAINWLCILESLAVPFPFDSGELLGKELRMAVEISEGDSQTTETGIFGPMNNTASGRIYGMLTCTRRCVLLLAALAQLSVLNDFRVLFGAIRYGVAELNHHYLQMFDGFVSCTIE